MHLKVGNTLYRLDTAALSRVSSFMKDMFTAPSSIGTVQIAMTDGTEAAPILLSEIAEPEFEIFALRAYAW